MRHAKCQHQPPLSVAVAYLDCLARVHGEDIIVSEDRWAYIYTLTFDTVCVCVCVCV
jgi:hypothetical protein